MVTFAADQDARERRIMAMLDDARETAIASGADVVSDLFEALDDTASDAAAEFGPQVTAPIPQGYRNLVRICSYDAVALAA